MRLNLKNYAIGTVLASVGFLGSQSLGSNEVVSYQAAIGATYVGLLAKYLIDHFRQPNAFEDIHNEVRDMADLLAAMSATSLQFCLNRVLELDDTTAMLTASAILASTALILNHFSEEPTAVPQPG